MASGFSEVTQKYFRKYFDHFDRDKIGRVLIEDLPKLVRACGAAPLEAELDLLKSTADTEGRGSCDFAGLCRALTFAFDNSVTADSAREACKGFDPDERGFIAPHELRFFLTTLGDCLTTAEANFFVEEMKSEMDMEGNLVFNDIVYKMTPEMLR